MGMETGEGRETALGKRHQEAGAKMGVWFGCALPDEFVEWGREYGYLRESVGLVDTNYRAYLEFAGPDRVRYLNAILTNNVKDLKANHGVVSLFLNPQGHIQAEIETYAMAETLLGISYAEIRERLIEGLDKYIIMDDVTLTDRTEAYGSLELVGPKAAATAKALTGVDAGAMETLEMKEAAVNSLPVRVLRRAGSVEFLTARGNLEALWDALREAARMQGGGAAGYAALNALRLEQGVAWFGYDFGEKQIPHEAGLQDSHISYTKGCYTGQEIVERVRSRGQVNRVRVGLRFSAAEAPAAGTALQADGKEFGSVTRAAYSPAEQAYIGMGYLRREKSAAGTVVDVASGGTATVAALGSASGR